MALCPECDTNLDIDDDDLDEGEIITCPECGADFEVVTTTPLELKRVAEDEDEETVSDEEGEDGDHA